MSTRFPYSIARTPPIPAVIITLSHPDQSKFIDSISAHIDTAADMTVVPLSLVQRLGLTWLRDITAEGLGAVSHVVGVYEVVMLMPGVARLTLGVVAHPQERFVLIGRDILNLFRVSVDGPNQVIEFH